MSQPKVARTFKFVGGPSRKRRRCAPPADREAVSTSAKAGPVAKRGGTQRTQRTDQPVPPVAAKIDEIPPPECNESGIAQNAASTNDEITYSTMPPNTTGDSSDGSLATIPPNSNGALDSLLEWAASVDLSMIPEGLDSVLEFENTLPLFSHPSSHMPSGTDAAAAGITASGYYLNGPIVDCPRDLSSPAPGAISPEDSSDVGEYDTGGNGAELGHYMPAVEPQLDMLFAQCKTSVNVPIHCYRRVPSK